MIPIELLAPAKNLECGIAAIDHGADAVYIGATNFGARHAAGNEVEDIKKLCLHAHQFGARVYATVNTLIYDDEMDDALKLVENLSEAGVDAILVQDMGLLSRIVTDGKHLKTEIHASTQTDNRTVEKVKWLRDVGFRRVVLARELSVDEIREIHDRVPDVELEVFVHGALCVSYSGQCYASQFCFGRSANRGACAQMCRMKYSLEGADGSRVADDAYYLSLKDQCQIENLEALINAGAVSLKVEGRLKDVAYVKNVVAAYSERLNEIVAQSGGRYGRASWGRVELGFKPDLMKSFNRGYTTYFANGRTEDIASFRTPKAIGEYVGKVKEIRQGRVPSFNVAGIAPFVNGDGLCYIARDGELNGFRVNRAEGNRLYPLHMPSDLRPGTSLYRSQDKAFDQLMEGRTATRFIPVNMGLSYEDKGDGIVLTLKVWSGECHINGSASIELERQEALKPQSENIRKQLGKLGGTIYRCVEIVIDDELDRLFIPSSSLAELRRNVLNNITITPRNKEKVEHGVAPQKIVTDRYVERYPYLRNISNETARDFYKSCGMDDVEISAMEVSEAAPAPLLMQCRHCIRYSLGYCIKNGGRRPKWKEPLTLRLTDGRKFRLEFDCRKCQMNVLAE